MAPIGHTRTRVRRDHAVIAPDGHVRAAAPGWTDTDAIVVISPRLGARFAQWIAEMRPGGSSAPPLPGVERFAYVTEGAVTVTIEGADHALSAGGYAFLPAGSDHAIRADQASSLTLFDKPFVPTIDLEAPLPVAGHEQDAPQTPLLGDEAIQVRTLLPDDPRYDMAVNAMAFAPGGALPFVETHVMEHGLLMLDGTMVYRLGDDWYPVERGDVIYMAPHCPQWAAAYGPSGARYLLYKDWNRDPPSGS